MASTVTSLVERGLNIGANFCLSAILQKIQNGRICLRKAAMDGVVYGIVNHKISQLGPGASTISQTVPFTFEMQDIISMFTEEKI